MNNAQKEAFKEVMRWLVLLIISGLSHMLPFFPTHLVPETITIFKISIPLQMLFITYVIPAILRFIDKWKHENAKRYSRVEGESMGVLPF